MSCECAYRSAQGQVGATFMNSTARGFNALVPMRRALSFLRGGQRGSELRAVVAALAALDLDELGRQCPATAVEIVVDCFALRLQPEPAAQSGN
jgi:hypothetical protein